MPGNGLVAEPGLSVVTPGSGVIMIIPVSVCHHVSTTGVRSPPMCSRYQTQASGLIGSPTPAGRRPAEESGSSPDRRPPVEDVHLVTRDDRPPPVLVRVVRDALVENAGGAVAERPVDDVAVPGD